VDSSSDDPGRNGLEGLLEHAARLGATRVAVLPADAVAVNPDLARLCRKPDCENYGLSRGCPPHVGGPAAFRDLLVGFTEVLFFAIQVPISSLFNEERREVFQLLHEVAAGIEHQAVSLGFERARAYAGGSCRRIFCHELPDCRALSEKGDCRNPRFARPSMSGFGIDVGGLVAAAGWPPNWDARGVGWPRGEASAVYGLVLIR
jgi:predicted metal-binding protein